MFQDAEDVVNIQEDSDDNGGGGVSAGSAWPVFGSMRAQVPGQLQVSPLGQLLGQAHNGNIANMVSSIAMLTQLWSKRTIIMF